jgi:hypothetical protein
MPLLDIIARRERRPGLAKHHDLSRRVCLGLDEHGVHLDCYRDTRRLCLHRLRPPNLAPVECGERVESHVLGLEGSDAQPILPEYPAEGSYHQALANR